MREQEDGSHLYGVGLTQPSGLHILFNCKGHVKTSRHSPFSDVGLVPVKNELFPKELLSNAQIQIIEENTMFISHRFEISAL